MINTRNYLKEIIGHVEVFGEDGDLEKAASLINGIPSLALLYHISRINLTLYLDQPGSDAVVKQNRILNSYLPHCRMDWRELFADAFERVRQKGNWQVIFWEYSNMIFYDLIFGGYNDGALRPFTNDENERFLKAYLMINSVINNGFTITEEQVAKAVEADAIERILVPNFTYQRDFVSNLDFKNQLDRGIQFFKYLELDPVFGNYTKSYYDSIGVSGFKEIFRQLLLLFAQFEIQNEPNHRRHQIGIQGLDGLVNFDFIDHLIINPILDDFKNDLSFSSYRKFPLYGFGDNCYLLLSINFFLDQFYRAQVFAFKTFIEKIGYKGNFLSKKGKDFMEDVYFRKLMQECFSHLVNLDGDSAVTNSGGELCDFYARKGQEILIIEFKDVLLNANVKNNADEEQMYRELDIKFSRNQSNSAKGISQLFNAAVYLQQQDLKSDQLERSTDLFIYPVVVYTDMSFGNEGINKIMNDKFSVLVRSHDFAGMKVNGVTFINLNYFEHHIEYLQNGMVDIFDMINGYQDHIRHKVNVNVAFETYSKAYFDAHQLPDIPPGTRFTELMRYVGL